MKDRTMADQAQRDLEWLPPLPLEAPPAALYERLQAKLAEEPRPASRSPRLRAAALLLLPLITLATLALDAVLRQRGILRADAGSIARVCMPSALAALALAVLSTAVAVSRGRHSLGQRVSTLRLATLAVAPLSLLPMLWLALAGDGSSSHPDEALHPLGLPCFTVASVIAGASLLVLILELRHSVAVALGWRSAALGSAAAAWSAFALLVHCSSVDLTHLMIGHWIPIVAFPLVSLIVAQRYLKL